MYCFRGGQAQFYQLITEIAHINIFLFIFKMQYIERLAESLCVHPTYSDLKTFKVQLRDDSPGNVSLIAPKWWGSFFRQKFRIEVVLFNIGDHDYELLLDLLANKKDTIEDVRKFADNNKIGFNLFAWYTAHMYPSVFYSSILPYNVLKGINDDLME